MYIIIYIYIYIYITYRLEPPRLLTHGVSIMPQALRVYAQSAY